LTRGRIDQRPKRTAV